MLVERTCPFQMHLFLRNEDNIVQEQLIVVLYSLLLTPLPTTALNFAMIMSHMKGENLVILLGFLLFCSIFVKCNKYQADSQHEGSCLGEFCTTEDEFDEPCMDEDKTHEYDNTDDMEDGLYRWDPLKVGHIRELELEPNKKFKVITRALQPPIFEIPGFLTEEECDFIVNKTKQHGLFSSNVHMDPDSIAHEEEIKKRIGHSRSPAGKFKNWDDDENDVITKEEIKIFAADVKYLYLNDKEVDEMIEKLELHEFNDGNVTKKEFENLKTSAMEEYLIEMKKTHPRHRDRYSEQTWMPQRGPYSNDIIKKLRERVVKLTRLPKKIVAGGEHLQVVRYGIHGHYHAHYDSQSGKQFPQFKCCHQHLDKLPDCRLCRYITILYYLNQPEEGGETAFPAADVEGFNETEFRKRKEGDQYNLSKFCHSAALVAPPKKGTAVMWYNHHLDSSGWLGDLDWRTLHGGCDILKGEKWIANNWLTAPNAGEQHVPSNYYLEEFEEAMEEDGDEWGPEETEMGADSQYF